jgi:hypothetical protein
MGSLYNRHVMRVVQTVAGMAGYRHQLDRVRRFLEHVEGEHANDVAFQDVVWAYFQQCWHLNGWVKNDPLASDAQKNAPKDRAETNPHLLICRDLCNGTKHFKLTDPSCGPSGASHSHVSIVITPGESTHIDCLIDDGYGPLISGKQLARDCLQAWIDILNAEHLNTTRLS